MVHATPPEPQQSALSRRDFVLGGVVGVGLAGVLAACGSDGAATTTLSETGEPPAGEQSASGDYTLVQRFPQNVAVPGVVRLPISLSTGTAELIQDGPELLTAQVVDIDGAAVGSSISATRRDAVPAPYYAFMPSIAAPGVYALVVDGGPPEGAAFQVFDADDVPVPTPGEVLQPFDTPTVDNARGVDPICTRSPAPCPFHDVTLTDAFQSGKGVVYYIGTPAFCSTGSCAPGLESLIEVSAEFADNFTFIHAEVYVDDSATTVTPAVESVGLFYEPTLFVTDSAGLIVERIDSTWNTEELREVLQRSSS